MKKLWILISVMALALLTSCDSGTPAETTTASTTDATTAASVTATSSTAGSQVTEPTEATTARREVCLYIPVDTDDPDVYPLPCTGEPDAAILLQGLAGLTGWNCDVNSVEILGDTARVDLADTSLPLNYEKPAEESAFFPGEYTDTVFLFLDSVDRTLAKNLNVTGVIFTQSGGQTLTLEKLNTTAELFPTDTLYRGSMYYRALLNDDPQLHGYPLIQLTGGMTLMYPNGYNVDLEHADEFRVSDERGTVICYRAYPVPEDVEPQTLAQRNVMNWAEGMDTVAEQFSSPEEYRLDATVGEYRFRVAGTVGSDGTRWFEITFLYESDTAGDMDQIVADLTDALKAYN